MSKLAILGGEKLNTRSIADNIKWPVINRAMEEGVISVLRDGNMSGTDITKQFEKEFGVNIPKETIDSAEIFCPGVGNFYKLWVLRGFKESPDEITEIIIKNVPTNIKKYMK